MKKYLIYSLSSLALLMVLTGCAVTSPKDRVRNIEALARSFAWSRFDLPTDSFDLTCFVPGKMQGRNKVLTIYIEGDGLSWISRSRISPDPTPVKPLGLLLALQHPDGSAAYIARPCQAGQHRNCSSQYWTFARFAPEVLDSFDQAIDSLKEKFKAEHLHLVGYSGGGAIAALAAARRNDVTLLITVAGNLDHETWTKHHRVSPLTGSLNPVDAWKQLVKIPQVHFVGTLDKNIPAIVAQSFAGRFPADHKPELIFVKDALHGCCWEKIWPDLLDQALSHGKRQ